MICQCILLRENWTGFKLKPFSQFSSENPCASKHIDLHTHCPFDIVQTISCMTQPLIKTWFIQGYEYCVGRDIRLRFYRFQTILLWLWCWFIFARLLEVLNHLLHQKCFDPKKCVAKYYISQKRKKIAYSSSAAISLNLNNLKLLNITFDMPCFFIVRYVMKKDNKLIKQTLASSS